MLYRRPLTLAAAWIYGQALKYDCLSVGRKTHLVVNEISNTPEAIEIARCHLRRKTRGFLQGYDQQGPGHVLDSKHEGRTRYPFLIFVVREKRRY